MTIYHVGVGEIMTSSRPGDCLRALALGSCVAVIMLEPSARRVGMAHVALWDSAMNQNSMREGPGHFADTAIPSLLARMKTRGQPPDPETLVVKLAGGARMLDSGVTLDIGRRNAVAIKQILERLKLPVAAEDLGGTISRTVDVDVDQGRVRVTSHSRGEWGI